MSLDADGGVKVLSEKTGYDDNFRNDRLDSELVLANIDNFSNVVWRSVAV